MPRVKRKSITNSPNMSTCVKRAARRTRRAAPFRASRDRRISLAARLCLLFRLRASEARDFVSNKRRCSMSRFEHTLRSYRIEREESGRMFLFFFSVKRVPSRVGDDAGYRAGPKVHRSTFVHAQRTRTTPRVLVVADARRVSPPPSLAPPPPPPSCRLTFFSAKVASRAWMFRSDDDYDDNDDDDSSSGGSDAVIQYGSLHTCQNKRTENENARSKRNSNRPSWISPTSPARADATRRRASRDHTVVDTTTRIRSEYKDQGERKG